MSNSEGIPMGARNGAAYPFIRIDNQEYNLASMDRTALMVTLADVQEAMQRIDQQIVDKETGRRELGIEIDSDWLRKANYARIIKVKQVQLLQAELATRKEQNKPLSEYFVDAGRRFLGEGVFRELLERARTLRDQELGLATV